MRRLALVLLLLCALDAFARVGGGDSYSGSSSSDSSYSSSSDSGSSSSDYGSGSSSSGSGGGSGGVIGVFLLIGLVVFVGSLTSRERPASLNLTAAVSTTPADLTALRRYDPNFSEIVFIDFCYSLFARLHEARGSGRLDDFAPYASKAVRDGMKATAAGSVDQIVIGSFAITGVAGLDGPRVSVDVEFEANYTEDEQRWYVREQWTLERQRDILSPAPENARAEHCPKCGAPLQTRTDGACLHCGTVIADGTFQWFVRSVGVSQKDQRAPVLTGGGAGPEPGLDMPTIHQGWIGRRTVDFAQKHPGFTWKDFEARVRLVARELQNAWTARDWEHARRYETGALFQMHRYWIDEYLRQGLHNIVDDYTIDKVDVAKITSDAFFDAITVRLYAHGRDYTVDASGNTVGGSPLHTKRWSEYWTLVRGRAGASPDARVCPNCGATRGEGQAVVCDYCGGRITTGEFPWILSRIEQDEAYRG